MTVIAAIIALSSRVTWPAEKSENANKMAEARGDGPSPHPSRNPQGTDQSRWWKIGNLIPWGAGGRRRITRARCDNCGYSCQKILRRGHSNIVHRAERTYKKRSRESIRFCFRKGAGRQKVRNWLLRARRGQKHIRKRCEAGESAAMG